MYPSASKSWFVIGACSLAHAWRREQLAKTAGTTVVLTDVQILEQTLIGDMYIAIACMRFTLFQILVVFLFVSVFLMKGIGLTAKMYIPIDALYTVIRKVYVLLIKYFWWIYIPFFMNIYFLDILFFLWGYQDILFLMSYQKNGIYPPTKSGIYPLYGKNMVYTLSQDVVHTH